MCVQVYVPPPDDYKPPHNSYNPPSYTPEVQYRPDPGEARRSTCIIVVETDTRRLVERLLLTCCSYKNFSQKAKI